MIFGESWREVCHCACTTSNIISLSKFDDQCSYGEGNGNLKQELACRLRPWLVGQFAVLLGQEYGKRQGRGECWTSEKATRKDVSYVLGAARVSNWHLWSLYWNMLYCSVLKLKKTSHSHSPWNQMDAQRQQLQYRFMFWSQTKQFISYFPLSPISSTLLCSRSTGTSLVPGPLCKGGKSKSSRPVIYTSYPTLGHKELRKTK